MKLSNSLGKPCLSISAACSTYNLSLTSSTPGLQLTSELPPHGPGISNILGSPLQFRLRLWFYTIGSQGIFVRNSNPVAHGLASTVLSNSGAGLHDPINLASSMPAKLGSHRQCCQTLLTDVTWPHWTTAVLTPGKYFPGQLSF